MSCIYILASSKITFGKADVACLEVSIAFSRINVCEDVVLPDSCARSIVVKPEVVVLKLSTRSLDVQTRLRKASGEDRGGAVASH